MASRKCEFVNRACATNDYPVHTLIIHYEKRIEKSCLHFCYLCSIVLMLRLGHWRGSEFRSLSSNGICSSVNLPS